jgi:hypothetical protein
VLRKLTPVVRTCIAAGLGLGFLVGLFFALGVPSDGSNGIGVPRADLRLAPAWVVGLTVLGGALGGGAALALEAAFREKPGSPAKKDWWRGKKASRRRD